MYHLHLSKPRPIYQYQTRMQDREAAPELARPPQMSLSFIAPGSLEGSNTSGARPPRLDTLLPPMQGPEPPIPSFPSDPHLFRHTGNRVQLPFRPHNPLSNLTCTAASPPLYSRSTHFHPYRPAPAPASPCSSTSSLSSRASHSRSRSPALRLRLRPSSSFSGGGATCDPLAVGGGGGSGYSDDDNDSAATRGDRVEYDQEERFAVAFFRLHKSLAALPWKELKSSFDRLFPRGTPRRATAPAIGSKPLPRTYPRRSVGGLTCRYYRIRDIEKMRPVRANRREGDGEREDQALVKMERVLVAHWVGLLGQAERERLGLGVVDRDGEPGLEWWIAATHAYREG